MKRKLAIIPIVIVVAVALVSAVIVVSLRIRDSLRPVITNVRPMEEYEVPPERIPPKNSFDNADMIIAFSSWDSGSYQFILSNGNELEASYGWRVSTNTINNNIKSIDFLGEIEASAFAIIPEDVYDRILFLANEIVEEQQGVLNGGAAEGHWNIVNIAIITPHTIYEITNPRYRPESSTETIRELDELIVEYSPLVVYTGSRTEEIPEAKNP